MSDGDDDGDSAQALSVMATKATSHAGEPARPKVLIDEYLDIAPSATNESRITAPARQEFHSTQCRFGDALVF
jgi:hypothetical protein